MRLRTRFTFCFVINGNRCAVVTMPPSLRWFHQIRQNIRSLRSQRTTCTKLNLVRRSAYDEVIDRLRERFAPKLTSADAFGTI